MITLSLLKYLEDNGFGTIDTDLFWQKLGLGRRGLYIIETGMPRELSSRTCSTYQIYSRGSNDVDGYRKLDEVMRFLNQSYNTCTLPAVPPVTEQDYQNVSIMPVSSITNMGEDINGRVIYSISGRIYYTDLGSPPQRVYLGTENNHILTTEDNKILEGVING